MAVESAKKRPKKWNFQEKFGTIWYYSGIEKLGGVAKFYIWKISV